MKKGFTLLELMVVVGIIGILTAVLLKTVSGSSDSARDAKCLANMHNLAAACHSVGMSESYYPAAGSRECHTRLRYQKGTNRSNRERYSESHGWVSWYSKGAYGANTLQSRVSSGWFISTYDKTLEKREYCLTNGALWRALNASASAYVCPLHQVQAKKHGLEPCWSYAMNSKFGYDESSGSKSHLWSNRLTFTGVKNTDRVLLFAELPFNTDNTSQTVKYTTAGGIDLDPTLQYAKDGTSFSEVIGFNHKSKRKWYAHVCFADGHTEKLQLPGDSGSARLKELTKWLCEGEDVTYDGSKYEKMTK